MAGEDSIGSRGRVRGAVWKLGQDPARHRRSDVRGDDESLRRGGDMLRQRAMRVGPAAASERGSCDGQFRQRREYAREMLALPTVGDHGRSAAIARDSGRSSDAPDDLRQIHVREARDATPDHG
jgi:hypothetical protein